ncbi:Fpg/Nei family DNA glycosylase [Propioniciclava soli]|uniref:Fpg/Nei family DNA glycosylase n=2 Tax=Propioniciclava soli TaxID=2775081 RepID=A0ABZ3C932_9ACTN
MPEMPEVEGLRAFLAERLVGATVTRAELAAFSALKTFTLPLSALLGQEITAVQRRGKFLCLDVSGTWLVFHLARAGWLRWYEQAPASPAKPGKGPLALRLVAEPAGGFDLTEAGTQKHLALYVVADPGEVPGIARLGPDPLADDFDEAAFGAVLAEHARTQIKGLLKDQSLLAGVGNAYSDEILQAAKLSPFKLAGSLTGEETSALYAAVRKELTAAIGRAVGLPPAELKDGKRSSLRVHGRKGEPCPVCGTVVAEVSFADSFLNYCPGCQTGGKLLADRRLSKLLK